MLKTFRANRNKLLGLFVVGICAFLMAGFGLSSFFGPRASGPIAKVGEYEISYNQLRRKHEQLRNLYRQRFGESFGALEARLNLKQQALDGLINDRVVEVFAEELGLDASKQQVEREILNNPYFGGQYNPSAYKTFLRSTGLTGGQLERLTRDQIVRDQIINLMTNISIPTTKESEGIRKFNNTAIKLDYVEIDPLSFAEKAKAVEEQQLADFFESQRTRYQVPRQIKLSYVAFTPNQYIDSVEILDEDINIYYEDNSRNFTIPRQYHLRQITLKKPKKDSAEDSVIPFLDEEKSEEKTFESSVNSVEAVKQRAKNIRQRLEDGEDFSKLASEVSEDKNSKNSGGSLGFVSVTELDPKIRKAADDLAIDDFSEVIETDDSFVLIYVQDMKDSSVKPLESVKEEIVTALKMQDAPLFAFEAAQASSDKFNSEKAEGDITLEAFAKAEGLETQKTAEFVGFNAPGDVPLQLLQKVIDLEPGDVQLVESGNTAYIIEVNDAKDAHIPELSSIKEQVKTDFVQSRQKELAQELANKIVAEVTAEDSAMKSLKEVAEANGLTLKTSPEVLRKSPPEGIFMLPNLKDKAFRLTEKGSVIPQVFPYAGKFVVAALAERSIKTPAEEEKEDPKTISSRESSLAADRLFQSLIQVLRSKQEIWVDTDQLLGET